MATENEKNSEKSKPDMIEYRHLPIEELRAVSIPDQPDGKKIVGYAAIFDTIIEMPWYREQVSRGAFSETIKNDDIRALFDHDSSQVLGRNRAGTLELREDEKGLYVEIVPPKTQLAADIMELIGRGDVSQMSIGFSIVKEQWAIDESDPDIKDLRTIQAVKLWDVSPVTFPANEDTTVALRSFQAWSHQHETPQFNPVPLMRRRLNLLNLT